MGGQKALRESASEFARRVFQRGYIVLIGVAGGVLGTYGDLFGGAIKLAPWVSWSILGASLFVATFWAFHDLRVERDLRIAELKADAVSASRLPDPRYDLLSDLLGRSLETGLELSANGDWPLRSAWETHTRLLVASAYGDGEAAHVFTPELGERKIYRGLDMLSAPPPLAGQVNSVRALLGRMPTLAIRPGFKPNDWTAFDPASYRAAHAKAVERKEKEDWTCPWCSSKNGPFASQCEGCGAEFAGDFAYRLPG